MINYLIKILKHNDLDIVTQVYYMLKQYVDLGIIFYSEN